MRRPSLTRITAHSGAWAAALFLALAVWYLPSLLNLDEFRPPLIDLLEQTFHCRAQVGNVHAEIVPYPGLIVGHVVLYAPGPEPRILASVEGVHLWISVRTLLTGRLHFRTIRFWKPQFFLHREREPSGENRWIVLGIPGAAASPRPADLKRLDIRYGTLEIRDHTTSPETRFTINQLGGAFNLAKQTGEIAGLARGFGPKGFLTIRYDRTEDLPLEIRLTDIELNALQSVVHAHLDGLKGSVRFLAKARFTPGVEIRATVSRVGSAGSLTALLRSQSPGTWDGTARGSRFDLDGTAFFVDRLTAHRDLHGFRLDIDAGTDEQGRAHVVWYQPAADKADPALQVETGGVTVRQVLEIFDLEAPPTTSTDVFNPDAYERWRIESGTMTALIHAGSFEILPSHFDVGSMHLDLTGAFDLMGERPLGHVRGTLQHVPVERVVGDFFGVPAAVTGRGRASFNLSFPLEPKWIPGLNGVAQVEVNDGIVRMLKTMYRVVSVLNLSNYLRLRLPKVTAEGIVFKTLAGHLTFRNGVLSSDDLYLKSPDMNLGAKGSVDLPGRRIDSTLRVELFRFLEDILRDVPVTHWIFRKPNKIFLPVVVAVEGPWSNVDVH